MGLLKTVEFFMVGIYGDFLVYILHYNRIKPANYLLKSPEQSSPVSKKMVPFIVLLFLYVKFITITQNII